LPPSAVIFAVAPSIESTDIVSVVYESSVRWNRALFIPGSASPVVVMS
jgi:hypothetical protein